MKTRRNRPPIIWMAILAVLMGTLAPSMTSLLAAMRGDALLEVCTTPYNPGAASLLARQAAHDNHAPVDHTLLHDGGHCPYCRLQQDVPTMPPMPEAPLLVATITIRLALQLAPTPPPLAPAWPPQLSRAPPQLS